MCGIIGIVGPNSDAGAEDIPHLAAYEAYQGLLTLQHRGQDAAGILAYDSAVRMFSQEKDIGLVAQVFDRERIEKLPGEVAIGHTRYATAGSDGVRDIQPLVTGAPVGLGMIHNGNILNYYSLSRHLTGELKRQLLTANDLEILLHYWDHYLLDGKPPSEETFTFGNIKRTVAKIYDTVIGGYAVLGIMAGAGLVAFRDPKGIRPLSIGRRMLDDGRYRYCICSESVAMNYLGYDFWRDLEPGEVVYIGLDGEFHSAVVGTEEKVAPCMFEWVYFSAAESSMEDMSVYSARLNLGTRLGMKARAAIENGEIAPDVVMPVPDTSRTAAISAADALDLPYREGLIKNRYVYRSFILNTQEKREEAVELKLSPIRSEIRNKRIFLIDDSVVRGTTARRIISLLKKHGAKEVVLGVTCPPIRNACYYGIDFPDPNDLIAGDRSIEEISDWFGASRVIYLDEEDLRAAIGRKDLCMACVNGKYPTEIGEGGYFAQKRKTAKDNSVIGDHGEEGAEKHYANSGCVRK